MLRKKCVVHPTLISATTGGNKQARIVKRRLPQQSPMLKFDWRFFSFFVLIYI